MITLPSLEQWLDRIRNVLNKWRLCFLIYSLIYTVILLSNLDKAPIQWDEVIHLNGGSFLYWQNYDKFILNAFYPPLFDFLILISFKTLGVSVFAARLVPVIFSILALWTLFELVYRMYNSRTAILSTIFLGVMPGFFWLSGIALLETALVFFTTASILFFYLWLKNGKDYMLVLSGLMIGLGLLTKYQMIIVGVILLFSLSFLAKNKLKVGIKKLTFIMIPAFLITIPWILLSYEVYASQLLSQWFYAMQVGNPERSMYSERFPGPIFYLIEMVWPTGTVHPISLLLYSLAMGGLIFLVWRHRREDKLVLIWFACIFAFFTLISNKEWRYVLPLFPAMAIAGSTLVISLYDRIGAKRMKVKLAAQRNLYKLIAILLTILISGTLLYSIYDTYDYVSKYDFKIEIKAATSYAYDNIGINKSIMLLCPFNFFSSDIVRFYLWEHGNNTIPIYQYPKEAVDAYTPNFNITELIQLCNTLKVQYLFTYEYGGTIPYYNSTLNLQHVYQELYASGKFTHIVENATFGNNPRRIFILEFIG